MNEHRNKWHALTETLGAAPFSSKYLTTLRYFWTAGLDNSAGKEPTNLPNKHPRNSTAIINFPKALICPTVDLQNILCFTSYKSN